VLLVAALFAFDTMEEIVAALFEEIHLDYDRQPGGTNIAQDHRGNDPGELPRISRQCAQLSSTIRKCGPRPRLTQ
jgi:hypothetical protein